MDVMFQGLLLGLFLSMLIGATFFILVETSIKKGFRAALSMNLGVFLSDVCIILVAYFGTSEVLLGMLNSQYFRMGAGIVFLCFGLIYLLMPLTKQQVVVENGNNHTRLFFKGFFINTLNPSVGAFWLASLVLALSLNCYTPGKAFMFFASCLVVVISIDILKIYFASKLKYLISERIIRIVSIATGSFFVILGLKVIYSARFVI